MVAGFFYGSISYNTPSEMAILNMSGSDGEFHDKICTNVQICANLRKDIDKPTACCYDIDNL
jgi:hypothetical protein